MDVIIYGAGGTGRGIFKAIKNGYKKGYPLLCEALIKERLKLEELSEAKYTSDEINVIAFSDSNPKLWGGEVFGLPVIAPDDIPRHDFGKIFIATLMSYDRLANDLHEKYGIPYDKIDTGYVSFTTIARDKWLSSFAATVYERGLKGNVAEGGVCEGVFARKINKLFPDRKIYLFDTFEGFDARDISVEQEKGCSASAVGSLAFGSEEKVMASLPHPEKAIIRKGYFPETAEGIEDEFVFVNLDFDLYKPIYDGLNFFYPKMVKGGVIIVHDFFNDYYSGVKKAVHKFCEEHENSYIYIPIGDEVSIGIMKN